MSDKAREVIGGEVSNYCIHTGHPAPTSDAEPLACEDCRTVRDAILAALAGAGLKFEEEWQPIESAPKGDTRIQLMRVKDAKFVNLPDILWIKVGSWCAWYADGYAEAWREDAKATMYDGAKAYRLSPTHWRHLPAAQPSAGER